MSEQPSSEPAAERSAAAAGGTAPVRRKHHMAGVLIGILTAALGFAIAVQVRAHSQSDSLSNLREDDLIGILDNQNARADRLRQQITELQQTLNRLRDSGNQAAVARQQAEQEAEALGILLGRLPATGPGVELVISDPEEMLTAEDLLNVVEELRGAGAEAIDFGGVRVTTATAFTTVDSRVAVDGQVVIAPYRVLAIGDPKTLNTALNIPGGVAATVRASGGDLQVTEKDAVTITTLRPSPPTRYVKPAER